MWGAVGCKWRIQWGPVNSFDPLAVAVCDTSFDVWETLKWLKKGVLTGKTVGPRSGPAV